MVVTDLFRYLDDGDLRAPEYEWLGHFGDKGILAAGHNSTGASGPSPIEVSVQGTGSAAPLPIGTVPPPPNAIPMSPGGGKR